MEQNNDEAILEAPPMNPHEIHNVCNEGHVYAGIFGTALHTWLVNYAGIYVQQENFAYACTNVEYLSLWWYSFLGIWK